MKTLTLLILSFFTFFPAFADIVILTDGTKYHGEVKQLNSLNLELELSNKEIKQIPVKSLTFCYISPRYDKVKSVKDLKDNWLKQQFSQAKEQNPFPALERIHLRNNREITIDSSPSSWQDTRINTTLINKNGEKNSFVERIPFNNQTDKVVINHARTISPDGNITAIPDMAIDFISPYTTDSRYNHFRQLLVQFPPVPAGTILDLSVSITHHNSDNFQLKEVFSTFNNFIGQKEITLITPEKKDWKLKDLIINNNKQIVYTHKKEKGQIQQTWSRENIPPIQGAHSTLPLADWSPTLLLTAEEIFWRNQIDEFSGKLKEVLKANENTLPKIQNPIQFAQNNFSILNTLQTRTLRPLSESFKYLSGDRLSMALLTYQLLNNNKELSTELLLAAPTTIPEPSQIFNLKWFETPVLRVNSPKGTQFLTFRNQRLTTNLPLDLQSRQALTLLGKGYGNLKTLPQINDRKTKEITVEIENFTASEKYLTADVFFSNGNHIFPNEKEGLRRYFDRSFPNCQIQDSLEKKDSDGNVKHHAILRYPASLRKNENKLYFYPPFLEQEFNKISTISAQIPFLNPLKHDMRHLIKIPVINETTPLFISQDLNIDKEDYRIKAYYRIRGKFIEQVLIVNMKILKITDIDKVSQLKNDFEELVKFLNYPLIFNLEKKGK